MGNRRVSIALFPVRHTAFGSISAKTCRRSIAVYACILCAGFITFLMTDDVTLQLFSLGIMFPGAGFLAHANTYSIEGITHIVMMLASVLVFCFAVVMWFATGNVVAPPIFWLLSAYVSAQMQHSAFVPIEIGWYILLGVVSVFTIARLCFIVWRLKVVKLRMQLNQRIEDNSTSLVAFQRNTPQDQLKELSCDDAKRMRFLLDRALQPVENFEGFEWQDQFQTAAVRYQINFMGYALAMAQATYMPAAIAYVSEAQRLLIKKLSNHKVWKYWRLENLWGNLRLDPDPIARENIMFGSRQLKCYYF